MKINRSQICMNPFPESAMSGKYTINVDLIWDRSTQTVTYDHSELTQKHPETGVLDYSVLIFGFIFGWVLQIIWDNRNRKKSRK